jgi:hypothetical protein
MLDLHKFLPILGAEVQKAFLPYEMYGYHYVETKFESTKALGVYLTSIVSSEAIRRQILVSYFPKGISEHGTLVVHLQKMGSDSFEAADGMRVKCAPEDERLALSLHTLEGTTVERVVSALTAARLGLDKYLLEVVKGSEWFHVPINWGNSR